MYVCVSQGSLPGLLRPRTNARLMSRQVPKPWGHELIWAETDRYVGKILHVKEGQALSLQYH